MSSNTNLSREERLRRSIAINTDPDLDTPRKRMGSDLKRPFNDDPGTQIDGFLSVWADEFEDLHEAAEDVLLSAAPDTARDTQLDRLGRRVFVPRQTGETDVHYRGRIKVTLRQRVGGGRIRDIKATSAALLDTSEDSIELTEDFSANTAAFTLSVDPRVLENAGVSEADYLDFMSAVKAGGVQVNAVQRGSFAFRAEGESSDPAKGWGGLDYTGESGEWAGLLGVA